MVRRLAPLALAAIALMGASSTRYRAGISPMMASHLEYANQAFREGRSGEAGGYAKALLIGEEITYAIAIDPESEPQRETALRALDAAAQTWREALNGAVTIRPVKDGETPNLVIHFEPDVQVEGRTVSGYIRWQRDVRRTGNGWEGTFEGQVHARTQFRGKPMSFEAMRCCLGHEMGHMFGLPDGVGKDPAGHEAIMGPLKLARPTNGPNETEIETVRNIRKDAGEIERLVATGIDRQAILELDGTHARPHDHDHAAR